MQRRLPILLIAIAALLAVEPLLHQHPLFGRSPDSGPASSATCVVCAAGVSHLTQRAPEVAAPVRVAYVAFTAVCATLQSGIALTLPARAPPAA